MTHRISDIPHNLQNEAWKQYGDKVKSWVDSVKMIFNDKNLQVGRQICIFYIIIILDEVKLECAMLITMLSKLRLDHY